MYLNLLVIRTKNIKSLAEFYAILGLEFDYHQHGKGAFHYSAKVGALVFEIYPLREDEIPDKSTRLGFKTENLIEKIKILESYNHKIISYPKETEDEMVAIIEDPDGRKIELTGQ